MQNDINIRNILSISSYNNTRRMYLVSLKNPVPPAGRRLSPVQVPGRGA